MPRVLIIGSCGAGKSTFAKELGSILSVPVVHLDLFHHKANWEAVEPEIFDVKLAEILNKPEWVIDGNYKRTLTMRANMADEIIFLDYPRWLCLYRTIKRYILGQLGIRTRDCKPDDCPEIISRGLFRWVWRYPKEGRELTLQKVHESSFDASKIVFLHSPREARAYLRNRKSDTLRPT